MARIATLPETPSQTAGPYVHIGLLPRVAGFRGYGTEIGQDIAGPAAKGTRIRVEGVVLDGLGAPVREAVVEIWQATAAGIYASPLDPRSAEVEAGFRGFGRVTADPGTGVWSVATVKPGPVAAPGGIMAPHLALWIAARGINIGLHTRLCFGDEAEANATCPVLARVPPARRGTLIAERTGEGAYRFDIRLQGMDETVFFDV